MIAQRSGPDWTYCIRCESVRPPRAHHCHQCDVCVIRFDHHCTFLAQCIGLANMKYFMRLLIQVSVCCFIATGFNLPYVFRHVYSDWRNWQTLLSILNPAPFALLGWLSWRHFFLCLITSLGALFGPALAIFFIYHLRQVLRNQTTVEVLIAKSKNPSQIRYYNADLRPMNFDLGWRFNTIERQELDMAEPIEPNCQQSSTMVYLVEESDTELVQIDTRELSIKLPNLANDSCSIHEDIHNLLTIFYHPNQET
nr:DHHC zinc finger membrane protein [Hymenolepis microstoma]